MSSDRDVKRFERKFEKKHPWFGTREDLGRLVSIAEECYASRRKQYLEANKNEASAFLRESRDADINEFSVSLTAYDKTGSLSGTADKVIAQMDLRRLRQVVIAGTTVSEARFGEATELEIELNDHGASISVASHDQAWLNEAFGRLYDEICKGRHPRWATLSGTWLRLMGWALSSVTGLSFNALVYFAMNGRLGGNIPYYSGVATYLATAGTLYLLNYRLPLFEVLPEGTRPKYGAFLRFMCITSPTTLAVGALVNLATG